MILMFSYSNNPRKHENKMNFEIFFKKAAVK